MPTLEIHIPQDLNASLEAVPDINAFAREALEAKLKADAKLEEEVKKIVANSYREADQLVDVPIEELRSEIRELHGKIVDRMG